MDQITKDYQLPIDNSGYEPVKRISIGVVDVLADTLVAEYRNPTYRKWYCGAIYEFGPAKIEQWRRRAEDGNQPGRLFTKYVNDARSIRGSRRL